MNDNENIGTQTAEETTSQEQTENEHRSKPNEPEAGSEAKPEKTFTQAELDAIVEKRLKRERLSAEEKADKALKEISALKTRNVCYKLGIREDCIEDAVTLAEKLVNDKTDISSALSKVLEKYPSLKSSADKRGPSVTGVHTETTHETDDSELRRAFGLPSKK